MGKIRTYLVMVLFACLSLTSCNEEGINIDEVNKETVFVYMPWTGSETSSGLYECLLINLDSIEAAIQRNGLKDTRVLVFLSESHEQSKLYEITYDQKAGLEHKAIKQYSGHEYTTADGIASILTDVKNAAYALNYGLIIGAHGTGWTHVSDWEDFPYKAPKKYNGQRKTPGMELLQYPETRFFGSSTDKRFSTDIEVLAEGIRKSGLHMQYILFDDCYMANVEVAYELRNQTNFLLGSTSEVIDLGIPYADMWTSLATPTPNYSSTVSAFYNFYKDYSTPCGTFAAIDCRQVESLASIMRQINQNFTFDETMLDDVQVLDGFEVPIFFDIEDYVHHLCTDPYLYERFAAQLEKTVVSKAATEFIYSHIYSIPEIIDVNTFSGMTISDPSQNVAAMRGKSNTSWWKATH